MSAARAALAALLCALLLAAARAEDGFVARPARTSPCAAASPTAIDSAAAASAGGVNVTGTTAAGGVKVNPFGAVASAYLQYRSPTGTGDITGSAFSTVDADAYAVYYHGHPARAQRSHACNSSTGIGV
eukprot:tig00020824_g14275.t1